MGDVVRALRAAALPGVGTGPYNIGGGSRVSLMDAIEVIERVAGRRILVDHREAQVRDVRDAAAATSRAARDLGFVPATTLEDGLAQRFEWARLDDAAPSRSRVAAWTHVVLHVGASQTLDSVVFNQLLGSAPTGGTSSWRARMTRGRGA